MKRITVASVVVALVLCSGVNAIAQEGLVRNRLAKIANGQSSEVKQELPDLLAEYPDDPGVRLLHAMLVEDAMKALPLYERIVRQYPDSEWADDAQWRIVQIYAVHGDADKARGALDVMRQRYPTSQFLVFATQLVKETVGLTTMQRSPSATPSNSSHRETTPTTSQPTTTESRSTTPAATTPPPTTTPIRETATETPARSTTQPAEQSTTKFTLQVGLFSNREAADVELERFRKLRMRSGIHIKNVDGVDKFAVTVGEYSSRESADRARQTVQKYCGCTPFIVEIVGN